MFLPGANGTVTLERVTFGDVYYCSGQSNMVGSRAHMQQCSVSAPRPRLLH